MRAHLSALTPGTTPTVRTSAIRPTVASGDAAGAVDEGGDGGEEARRAALGDPRGVPRRPGDPLRAHRAAEGAAGVAGRAATHRPASTAGRGGQARRLDRGAGARWGDRAPDDGGDPAAARGAPRLARPRARDSRAGDGRERPREASPGSSGEAGVAAAGVTDRRPWVAAVVRLARALPW